MSERIIALLVQFVTHVIDAGGYAAIAGLIDTDVVLRLCDVYPDGRSVLISEGGYRLGVMCFQKDKDCKENANKVHELKIDLWATSMVFAKGHAIRLSVSSSSFPRFEKNMNVGLFGSHTGKYQTAKNRVLMGEKTPSRLFLPIVQEAEKN